MNEVPPIEITSSERDPMAARLRHAYREHLSIPAAVQPQLADALRETLRRPGNLVRAELAFQVALVYGLHEAPAEHLSTALEYFHTASLLFDDLPSMDDAVHRRGALCIHQIYGEGTAILSALALVNRAYALIWSAMQDLSTPVRRQASEYLECYLGLNGILDGQSRDLHFASSEAEPSTSQQIALEKTSSLIRLPLVLPAIMGGASAQECNLLHRLAKLWGLGYQALDDLKDVLREQHHTGKTTGRDELLARPNVALELGIEATVSRLHRLAELSGQVISRLTAIRPALLFLQKVSARFDAELQTTMEDSLTLQHAEGVPCSS